jgi:predicted RNA-binding protein
MSYFELKENTHIVIKREDVLTLVTSEEAVQLANILQKIEEKRLEQGRKIKQSYYVINQDEPYARQILNVIMNGEITKKSIKGE